MSDTMNSKYTVHEFGNKPYYEIGEIVSYRGKYYVAILDNRSSQFREDAWAYIPHPDKCITLMFAGKVDTIIREVGETIYRHHNLQSQYSTVSFSPKPHGPAGDWCQFL